ACSPLSQPWWHSTITRARSIGYPRASRPSWKSSPTSFSGRVGEAHEEPRRARPRAGCATLDPPQMAEYSHRKGHRLMNQINVVPYIDVMLVLLVIFMVTAPLITTTIIDLPSISRSSTPPAAPIEIMIRD